MKVTKHGLSSGVLCCLTKAAREGEWNETHLFCTLCLPGQACFLAPKAGCIINFNLQLKFPENWKQSPLQLYTLTAYSKALGPSSSRIAISLNWQQTTSWPPCQSWPKIGWLTSESKQPTWITRTGQTSSTWRRKAPVTESRHYFPNHQRFKFAFMSMGIQIIRKTSQHWKWTSGPTLWSLSTGPGSKWSLVGWTESTWKTVNQSSLKMLKFGRQVQGVVHNQDI